MQNEKRVFLLTGSNIEPRARYLALADKEIEINIGKVICRSSIYDSEPWGFKSGTNFLNQVLVVLSELTPFEILKKIGTLENKLGRLRKGKSYISRTIDVDILYIEKKIIESPDLTVPHPRLHERRFTLLPLTEVAAGFIHPVLNKTNTELLQKLTDQSQVWKVEVNKSWENV